MGGSYDFDSAAKRIAWSRVGSADGVETNEVLDRIVDADLDDVLLDWEAVSEVGGPDLDAFMRDIVHLAIEVRKGRGSHITGRHYTATECDEAVRTLLIRHALQPADVRRAYVSLRAPQEPEANGDDPRSPLARLLWNLEDVLADIAASIA